MTDTPTYILAIDQGTSSTKTIIFDQAQRVVAQATEPLSAVYLEGGLVEQNPKEIIAVTKRSIAKCLELFCSSGLNTHQIMACGISNQRETFVLWDKEGNPLYNAVVWQCKRSTDICREWIENGLIDMITNKTGLLVDPYFSASKLVWLQRNNEAINQQIQNKQAHFGTIDTWLLYHLTDGRAFLTDHTNASRTLFFNLHDLTWDADLIKTYGLTGLCLPDILCSADRFGETNLFGLLDHMIPIHAMIGDSQSAAIGEGCFFSGYAKATLGTGCSLMINVGEKYPRVAHGLVTTIAWSRAGRTDYAVEGVIVSCGSTIEWLKKNLRLFEDVAVTEAMAESLKDNNGVYLVPAFSGMGAPYWAMNAKAAISGLSFDTTAGHIVRAALEAIGYQIRDVLEAVASLSNVQLERLAIHGGISQNQFVIGFLAALCEAQVLRSIQPNASCLGAARLAGLEAGIYTLEMDAAVHQTSEVIKPLLSRAEAEQHYLGWKDAVQSVVSGAKNS
jgi:glycerol kinase